MEHENLNNRETAQFGIGAVGRGFFKRFTIINVIGLSIALIAWVGDSFLGWQDNIGYYLMGMFAACFMSNKNDA